MKRHKSVLFVSLFISLLLQSVNALADGTSGVILLYHHVSDSTPASTSISPAQLREHLSYLKEHHQVISLKTLIDAIQTGQSLPDNAVVITFDDGYRNILENGHPILQAFGFPYTIFINPNQIGERRDQLTWDEVKQMSQQGVLFANHTLDHAHMLQRTPNETDEDWLARRKADIVKAEALIEQHVGYSLKYFAYPYGEFNRALSKMLDNMGFIGFGQQSGAVGPDSDKTTLPRFPAAGIYSRLESLKTKLNSLPLAIISSQFLDYEVNTDQAQVSLTLLPTDFRMEQLQCYFKGEPLSADISLNSVAFNIPLSPGRTRVNCTAPSIKQPGRYYWYSQPFFKPDQSGHWLD